MTSQTDLRFYRDPVGKYRVDTFRQLGNGTFGIVHSAINEDQVKVAVKRIPFNTAGTNKVYDKEKQACIDINLIKQTHENVVKILDIETTSDPNALWVFMELCNKGDLNKYFRDEPKIIHDLPQKFELMKQIARGILFLHDNKVIHRDIKPGNIIMQSNNAGGLTCKLTDFGLIKKKLDGDKSSMNTDVGTRYYMAPEFWNKEDGQIHYHKDVDIFAAGLTFLAMIQAKEKIDLVPKAEDADLSKAEENMAIGQIMYLRQVEKKKELDVVYDNPDEEPTIIKIKNLIMLMTDVTPSERLTAKQLVKQLGGRQGYVTSIAEGNRDLTESYATDEASKVEEITITDINTDAPQTEHFANQTTEPGSQDHVDALDEPNVVQENDDALLNKSFSSLGDKFCIREIAHRIPPGKLDQFGIDVGIDRMEIEKIKGDNPVGNPSSTENRNRELINILIDRGDTAPVRLAYDAFNNNGLADAAEKLMRALKK